MPNLPFFIARRYLFAKKSHNVINIISAISAAGMAIGTAALVIILSVYNGFDSIVRDSLSNIEPDIRITPAEGKVFIPEGEAFDWLYEQEEVSTMCSVLNDYVYVDYDGRNAVAKAKGVDKVYEEESPLADHIYEGKFSLHHGQVPMAVVGAGLAAKLNLSPRFVSGMEIYFPDRNKKISAAASASSLTKIKIWPSGTFATNTDADNEMIILPLEKMRELLGYTDEVSAIEIRLKTGHSAKELRRIMDGASERLGEGFTVSDRFMQNESLYKMMRYEKVSVFLILVFVVIIIAFNIFGSLSMLIIEKRNDITTLRSMGAGDRLIRRIFVLEGWMISLLGLLIGLIAGLLFAFAQSRWGFIKMPGTFTVSAYPVIVKWADIAVIALSIAVIGYVIALLPARGPQGVVAEGQDASPTT